MSAVVGLVVALPLVAAMVSLAVRNRATPRDLVTICTLVAVSAMAIGLLFEVEAHGSVVVRVGGWSPELGIVLVADMLRCWCSPCRW